MHFRNPIKPSPCLAMTVLTALAIACPGGRAAPAPNPLGERIELTLPRGEWVQRLCLSPDNGYLAAAVEDARGAVSVSADGSTAALAEFALDPRSKVRVWAWSVKTGKLRCEIPYVPKDSAVGLAHLAAVSRDGSYLVAAVLGLSPPYVFDVARGKQLRTCRTEGSACRLAASPAADVFACWTASGKVEVWQMCEGRRLMSVTANPHDPDDSPPDEGIGDLQFSSDGTRLAWGTEVIRVVRAPTTK